jgi:hypothetical protein
MLTLARILDMEAGDGPLDGALDGCLGDRYLCRHNPLFAAIRARCLSLGYQFSQSGEIWQDYIACPLLCLQTIIQQRAIPYIDNVSTLRRFLAINAADFAASARFVIQILTPNHVMHESAHCVADDALRSGGEDLDKQAWVLRALMAEAYANSVERIASVFARNATHLFYLSLNSYLRPELEERDRLVHAADELGVETLFRATYLAYVVNNMACRPVTEAEMRLIASVAADRGQRGAADILVPLAARELALSQGFLEKTTPSWFRFMGAEAAYTSLRTQAITADWLEAIHSQPAVSELVRVALAQMEVPAHSTA